MLPIFLKYAGVQAVVETRKILLILFIYIIIIRTINLYRIIKYKIIGFKFSL